MKRLYLLIATTAILFHFLSPLFANAQSRPATKAELNELEEKVRSDKLEMKELKEKVRADFEIHDAKNASIIIALQDKDASLNQRIDDINTRIGDIHSTFTSWLALLSLIFAITGGTIAIITRAYIRRFKLDAEKILRNISEKANEAKALIDQIKGHADIASDIKNRMLSLFSEKNKLVEVAPEGITEPAKGIGIAPIVMHAGLNMAMDIKIGHDGRYIYLIEFGIGTGTIKKICIEGNEMTILATKLNIAYNLTVDSTDLYFTEGNAHSRIMKVPLSTGESYLWLTTSGRPMGITADESFIYWTEMDGGTTNLGSVKKRHKGGGETIALANGLNPYGIITDDTSVYWVEPFGGNLKKISKNGGEVSLLASGLQGPTMGIACDEENIYWGEGGMNESAGSVKQIRKIDGRVITLASGDVSSQFIAIDSTHVYWTEQPHRGGIGNVKRIPKGGGRIDLISVNNNNPCGIAVDSNFIYWVEGGDVYKGNGALKKIAKQI